VPSRCRAPDRRTHNLPPAGVHFRTPRGGAIHAVRRIDGADELYRITRPIVGGADFDAAERYGWRKRYRVDMRTKGATRPDGLLRDRSAVSAVGLAPGTSTMPSACST